MQVPWPHAADADTISCLACTTFKKSVQDKPFRISRVVLSLHYCNDSTAAPPALEKRGRGDAAQQSILRFVSSSNSSPPAVSRKEMAVASTGGNSCASGHAARGGKVTLQSFFAPSRRADDSSTSDNCSGYGTGIQYSFSSGRSDASSSQCANNGIAARGAGCEAAGKVDCGGWSTARASDIADEKKQKRNDSSVSIDVVVID